MKVTVLCLVVAFLVGVSGTYFKLAEKQQRCFIEEVPTNFVVLGKYNAYEISGEARAQQPHFRGAPAGTLANSVPAKEDGLGIRITVKDPEGNPFTEKTGGLAGRFAFTSRVGGEYVICVQTNTSRWFGSARQLAFHLDLVNGVQANDYDEIARVEHLSSIEVSLRRLNDRVAVIRAEQSYQRAREAAFRDLSEEINERVAWWSLCQILILVGAGMWQIYHLRSFFLAKKLV